MSGTSDAWDVYFTGPVPPEGGVNWDAYTHDELYQMLWQDADVADVSTVATDWAQHRAALLTHAEVLREQRVALLESWQGPAAEEAANRLDALADRMEKISELARAGQQAAQDAADALAMARAMMPPPPGSPAAPFGAPAMPAMPSAPATPSMQMPMMEMPATQMPAMPELPAMPDLAPAPSAPAMPGFASSPEMLEIPTAPNPETFAPATGTSPAGMNTAFGAVGGGGSSFYFGDVMADQQKAQAVRTMQTYESSLNGGSQLIGEARGAIPAAAQTTSAAAQAAPTQGMGSAGVPWERLVGSGTAPGLGVGGGAGAGMAPVIGGPGAGFSAGSGVPPGPGGRVGALPGTAGGSLMPAGKLAAESMAARAAGQGGLVPPVGGQRGAGADTEHHENRMPVLDHGLFTTELPQSGSVIGLPTGGQQ